MAYRLIQVGTGGAGAYWCKYFLTPSIQAGQVEVVAAVDINPQALETAQTALGLRRDQCYTDLGRAFDEVRADFCSIVIPPAFHEQVVDLALAHDMHILSEKPIADTMPGSVRIAQKVKRSGVKMGVTMSHRFEQDKTTLRSELASERYGALDYLVCRFACDCRKFASWGKFRYEMLDPLMIEGAVHHLDLLADMTGALCDTVYAQTWLPSWGEFAGDAQGLVLMHLANGTRVSYEGSKTNTIGLNPWGNEYIRAECEKATLILNHRELERFTYDPAMKGREGREGQGEKLPLLERSLWGHQWLIDQFIGWLDGGEPMATNVADNLQSVAIIFAAIESSRTNQPVNVQDFLRQHLVAAGGDQPAGS